MAGLNTSAGPNLRPLVHGLHRLYATRDLHKLPEVMLQVAEEVAPCDLISFDAIDQVTGHTVSLFDRPAAMPMTEFAQRWSSLCHTHPLVRHLESGGTGTVLALMDFISARQFRELPVYQEIFRPLGITGQQIALVVPVKGYVMGVALNRSSAFTDQDREALTLLQAHLALAYENALLFTSIQSAAEIDYTMWRRRGLTLRQCEVLRWLLEGKRDSEIGIILSCSTRTVHTHVGHILAKLGVETRTAAAKEAQKILQNARNADPMASISPKPLESSDRDLVLR